MPLNHDRLKDDALSRALASINLKEYIETSSNQVARHEGKSVYILPLCPICGGGAHLKVGESAFISFADCAKGGTIIDYLIVKDGLSTGEAIKQVFRLAKTTPLELSVQKSTIIRRETSHDRPVSYNFTPFVERASLDVGETDYFTNRGLSKTTITKYKLGFAKEGLNKLEGLPIDTSKKRFRARYKYIFPFLTQETDGEVIYLQTRLDPKELNEWEQKKLNLPKAYNLPGLSIPLYNVYHLDENPKVIFVVEGPFDALSIEEIGYPAIALCGVTNLNKLINEITKRNLTETTFILIPDNDQAGSKLKDKYISAMQRINVDHEILEIEKRYKDANDLLIKDRTKLEELVTQKSKEIGGINND